MAGIGFELKKLFHRKGLVAMVRAYGYAGVICTGPMLLGILLQFGVLAVSGWWHVPRADQNLLVCMITYTSRWIRFSFVSSYDLWTAVGLFTLHRRS